MNILNPDILIPNMYFVKIVISWYGTSLVTFNYNKFVTKTFHYTCS